MLRSAPKRIVITGASSGLGAALALYYAAPGVDLLLTGRNPERLTHVTDQARAKGAQVDYICLDVRDCDALSAWLIDRDRAAPIDLVIANAGISGGPRDGLEAPMQVDDIYAVNVMGVMNTILPLLLRMLARRHGHIALMSSLAGFAPWPGAPAYAASKAAVRIHGLALRTALRHTGVSVSVICPGFVDTPMTAVNPYSMPWIINPERAAKIIAKGLLNRRALITFPKRAAFAARFIGMLPIFLQERILSFAPSKPARDVKS